MNQASISRSFAAAVAGLVALPDIFSKRNSTAAEPQSDTPRRGVVVKNRNAADGGNWQPNEWIEALRVGNWRHYAPANIEIGGRVMEFPNGVMQIVTLEDLQRCVNAWENAGRPELLMDQDHFASDPAQPTDALGWVQDMEIRGSGSMTAIWVKPRYSAQGLEKVSGGVLRYQSPVIAAAPDAEETALLEKELADAADPEEWAARRVPKVHPYELRELALTNKPAMRGLCAVANRQAKNSDSTNPAANDGHNQQTKQKPNMDPQILKRLGLAEGATLEEVLAKIDELTGQADTAEKMANRAAAAFVEANKAKLPTEEVRNAWRDQFKANPEAAEKLLNGIAAPQPPAAAANAEAPAAAVFNRAASTAPQPPQAAAAATAPADTATDEEKVAYYNRMPSGPQKSAYWRANRSALSRGLSTKSKTKAS